MVGVCILDAFLGAGINSPVRASKASNPSESTEGHCVRIGMHEHRVFANGHDIHLVLGLEDVMTVVRLQTLVFS
jgi:hypothetical protein